MLQHDLRGLDLTCLCHETSCPLQHCEGPSRWEQRVLRRGLVVTEALVGQMSSGGGIRFGLE